MRIVQDGIPGMGMPAFHSFTASEAKAVVLYLRTLQGVNQTVALPGAPGGGKDIFSSKGRCSACHMVAGSGGFIASDLSGFARTHSAQETRRAIVQPTASADRLLVVVKTRDGRKYSGRIRDEDNFSLQLQTLDGAFHSFDKVDIDRVELDPQAQMPTDYGSSLSPKELDDLVSYLITSARTSESTSKKGIEERE